MNKISRLDGLEAFIKGYHGERLLKMVSPDQFAEIKAFIKKNDHLDHLEFEYATNRIYLDKPKPNYFAAVMEILQSANDRAKGVRK